MLSNIKTPADIKKLDINQLKQLAEEIREFLIESLKKTGGHLGSNLGTVELTIAMHYVFDSPKDSFVWDVGHQSYTHKILTGRKDKMHTIRQKGGLSGFTNINESKYDVFGAGHSSTSISAALGMAIANKIKKTNDFVIAVAGDGALTGGMAFEAMNHAGDSDANLIIILNDNDMSISKNVGSLNKYLTRLISGKIYSKMKDSSLKLLKFTPRIRNFAKRSEEHLKGMILPSTLFEEMGINYFGPINGHDLPTLIKTLQNLKNHSQPRLLHIATVKGKGLEVAEKNPTKYHGIAPPSISPKKPLPSYSQVFGRWLCDTAEKDEKIIGITPAMCEGSGMVEFSEKYKDRYFDVAIAEQHSITFAGGMSIKGFRPIVAIYSTFLQRGYDQFIHDIAVQNLNVIFAIDRAGLVGADGPTHAGIFDLCFLRCIPNVIIMAPSSSLEMYEQLNTAYSLKGPICIRFPRGNSEVIKFKSNKKQKLGKANVVRKGKKVAILAFGPMLKKALEAGNIIDATVVDMRFVKPLDEELIIAISKTHEKVISIEDNSAFAGAGSAISEVINNKKLKVSFDIIGMPDKISEHGTQEQLYEIYGLSVKNILNIAKS